MERARMGGRALELAWTEEEWREAGAEAKWEVIIDLNRIGIHRLSKASNADPF
jgi:hypothetical protein